MAKYSENRATHATKRQLNMVRFEYFFIEKKRDEKNRSIASRGRSLPRGIYSITLGDISSILHVTRYIPRYRLCIRVDTLIYTYTSIDFGLR